MEIHPNFSVPILYHSLDEEVSNDIEQLLIPRLSDLTSSQDQTQLSDFKHSQKIFNIYRETPILSQEIEKSVKFFCKNWGVKIPLILDYWVQDYKDNHYHSRHNHPLSLISGIYWVRANKYASKLRIYSPNPYDSFPLEFKQNFFDITPKKGLLILFPSYIYHEVLINSSNSIRTTIAFNLK